MMRWVIKKNRVTAEMVREYATKENLPLSVANKELRNEQMSLQYWDAEAYEGATGPYGAWIDVPNVVVYRDNINGVSDAGT